MSGFFDEMPAIFQRELQRLWNQWLAQRYANTEVLRKAWRLQPEPLGKPMLRNPRFTEGLQGWSLEQHGEARGTASVEPGAPNGSNAVRIEYTRTSPVNWHGQFNQSGLRVEAERRYTLRFYARASHKRTLGVNIGQAHPPWAILGFDTTFEVSTEWREYRFSFTLAQSDDNARVNFYNLAEQTGAVYLADVQLMPGGEPPFLPAGDVLGERRVPLVRQRERGSTPLPVLREWLAFLWETERAYWREMADYIKRELGYQGIVVGTIIGCSTPHLMAQLDAIDSHAYWMHPEFPGAAWDPNNWFVRNLPMVNSDSATVHRIGLMRVLGKPFTVSEYDHPAPNAYAAEGGLTLAAHAALQDWDGLFLFEYGAASGEGRINGYFEQRGHPAKWAFVRACAALFVRGDVRPATKLVCAALSQPQELDALLQVGAWSLPDGRFAGLDGKAVTLHRMALALDTNQVPRDALSPQSVSVSTVRTADTGEVIWNRAQAERSYLLVRTRRSKVALGFIAGRTLDWGDGFTLQVVRAPLDGFAVVALTVVQTQPRWRALLTALSFAENTDWNLRTLSEDRITVGNQWGNAPTRVSVPTLRLTLPFAARQLQAWALDATGARLRSLNPTPQGKSRALLEFTPALKTIWCELEAGA
ncbi:MAG: carbohydrate binding domain-containing protein, partial [Armatimonadota bacterium]|nr:carbohydrate binding domain-containing protein [Armatimonadota bacterium]